MKIRSVRAACISSTAAALLFAPAAQATPVAGGGEAGGCGVRCADTEVDALVVSGNGSYAELIDQPVSTAFARYLAPMISRTSRPVREDSGTSSPEETAAVTAIVMRAVEQVEADRAAGNPAPVLAHGPGSRRSDSQSAESKVSTLAAASGSTAYMDGIFNVGPGWRTITMPDGSRCGAGCNEVKWNYMTSTGKTGSAAAAGAWMDAHDTPDAVLYTYSGSAVGAQDARSLRPDWQGTIIELGSPSRPNNGATYEEGGRPVPQVGGGSIQYVSTKSDEAAVRTTWYGNHTSGYRGRDFSKETPVSETQYGDNVIDRVYADPPNKLAWLTGPFTPKPSVRKIADEDYVGKHRRDETSTATQHLVKDMVDEVKKLTTKKKQESKSGSTASSSHSPNGSGGESESKG
ncbi:hypothetical protein FK535_11670 [Mycolicibacterium sp. 018/SC-01/001]|uniref:hypothetical protein n=1 Tax=Mycolicibacterium sp. 018/SC-01/001 TaxID=2592069 RepID=UPI00117C1D39|nr:hypothetical protein [Mycolicibacterium sp. 018/SC-01/001]TRW83311.1 hypothetical protein FK535_11670 [Mycolicibacterium sp. 018/SC-01/001]